MPKFERVDNENIKVTREVETVINIPNLVAGKQQIEKHIKETENRLEHLKEQLDKVKEALTEAKKLGIKISKSKDIDKPKENKDDSNDN